MSVFLLAKITSIIVKNRHFKNYETESNLLVINKNKSYDILIAGISHARNFSRHKNQLRVEKILNKSTINIGQGGGICGAEEQYFYLDYFYHKKNKTKKVLYVLSTPILFSQSLPMASNTFNYETFEFDFFYRYLFVKTQNKGQRLFYYVKSKFDKKWFKLKPAKADFKSDSLLKVDTVEVKNGQKKAFMSEKDSPIFRENCLAVENTIKLAQANNSELIFIIPPAVFGKWIGHEETMAFANEMTKKYGVKVYDFSETMLDPKYYYDHHHLNSKGVSFFTEKYLKPILK
jgi:hypothetical protein